MSAILSCQLLQYAIFVIECTRLHQVIYQLSNFQMLLEKLLVVLQLAYLSGISALCETSTMVHETKRAQFIDDAPVKILLQSVAPNEVIISVSYPTSIMQLIFLVISTFRLLNLPTRS